MKKFITMAVSLYSLTVFAQVGINNNSPKATLDITAKTTDGSKPEGLLAPRLTGDQIQAADAQYTAAQKGLIMYATSAPASPAGKTVNMTAEGYYFFDGSVWQKITGIITGDATTTAKGIIQLAGDLSGTAASPAIANNAVTSAKILDGTIATADLGNSSVTSAKLENNIVLPGTASTTLPSGTTAQRPASPVNGMVRYNTTTNKTEMFQNGSWLNVDQGTTYSGSTSVILNGTSFERAALTGDVTATANSNATTIANNAVTSAKILDGTVANADLATGVGGIYKGSGSLSGNTTVTQGANTLAFTSTATNGFSVDGTTLSVDASNNRVGIGTATPAVPLDVAGNLNVSPQAGTASSLNLLENTANGNNMISLKAPASVTTDRVITLPSNAPSSGYALITDVSGNTSWGAVNPSASTLSSIALIGTTSGVPISPNASTPGSNTSQRFFQTFDTTIVNPLNNFNLATGTYTAPQAGNYLVTAYIVPNAAPYNNTPDYYYAVNLEVRKNCGGLPGAGTILMDAANIRYATPNQSILRFTVTVTGMVTLSAGDTLDLVILLNGGNASALDTGGNSFPTVFTYAPGTTYKALFSVTAL